MCVPLLSTDFLRNVFFHLINLAGYNRAAVRKARGSLQVKFQASAAV